MKRLFEGSLWVHYGQAYIFAGSDLICDFDAAFRGQSNGICGAACPNTLFLITGLHTGRVNFTVEFCDDQPPLDPVWEDVVEVSFTAIETPVLEEWGAQASYPLDLAPKTYRARYAGRGMDAAHAVDSVAEGEQPVDTYQLSFWPAAKAVPDCVIRQSSQTAAYWNRWASSLQVSAPDFDL
jgi:hypothetical protein